MRLWDGLSSLILFILDADNVFGSSELVGTEVKPHSFWKEIVALFPSWRIGRIKLPPQALNICYRFQPC